MNELLELFLTFSKLGLLAFGGLQVVIGEFQREIVVVHQWLSPSDFIEAYALGQLAPGPNMLFSILIGYKVAGIPGALAAGAGMFLPTTFLTIAVGSSWHRFRDNQWVKAVQRGLLPLALGLMFSGAFQIGRLGIHDVRGLVVAGVAAALVLSGKATPFMIIVLAGLVGLLVTWGL